MFILDPDFYPSRIPNPTTATKEEGGKNRCPTFLKNIGLGSRIRDPGFGKELFRIPDPVEKEHRIPDPDPQH
jgi:hypothetical protein